MRAALAICGLLLAAPAYAQPNWIVGNWYGYGQPDDKSSMWLETVLAGGKVHVQHRSCIQGKAFDQRQEGSWSLKGDILTLRIEKVDGESMNPPRADVYRLLKHSATQQTYRYEATGFVYNSRKVDGKFQLPPCDLSS